MGKLLLIITAVFLGVGIYYLGRTLLRLPPRAVSKAYDTAKGKVYKESLLDRILRPVTKFVAKLIKINPEKRLVLESNLKRAEITSTPELYYARGITRGLFCMVIGGLFILAINKAVGAVVLLLGVMVIFREFQSVDKIIKKNKNTLENEVPRLISSLNYSLSDNPDIVMFFRRYRNVCCPALRLEINWVLFRMQSGNIEQALRDWDTRLKIPAYSLLINNLICIQSGVFSPSSLVRVEMDVRAMQREKIQRMLKARPQKATWCYILLMIAFLIGIFVMLFSTLISNLGTLGI